MERLSAQTARPRVALAAVISCLLVFAGLLSVHDRFRPADATGPAPASSGDRVVAHRVAPAVSATSSLRITGRQPEGRAVSPTGSRLPGGGSSDVLPPGERIGFLDDRASAGTGEHLSVGPGVVQPEIPAPRPAGVERVSARPTSAPHDASAARAPPAV